MSVFGLRSTSINDGNQLVNSVDNQRAMKQLEMSNKIQTGLELKIDTLKKEIRKEIQFLRIHKNKFDVFFLEKLTDELHSTQKNHRSVNDQLSDTKKRLRDTQHDLKELEDKYKRYSDALYRVRSETRSTLDHLTHVLGIKEKQPSQARKSEDETKKPIKIEGEKIKQTEKPIEQEQTNKIEGKNILEFDRIKNSVVFRNYSIGK
jgi:chromosome segregation ATPase